MKISRVIVFVASFIANSAYATSSRTQQALALCQQLYAQLPSQTAIGPPKNNLTAAYLEATTQWANNANADDIPACVLFPSTAADVSAAMQLLSKSPSVPFALKSGGHDWNRGFSSTNGGVLISFRPFMNYTTLSSDQKSAEIGPGARWDEVIGTLDTKNRTAVGGRNGDVGVGGYIPKGGISYLTAQFVRTILFSQEDSRSQTQGFASDNVISFELVLANGTIITVSHDSHGDLFWGMRGAGSLFGVITSLTLQTHPIGNIWGGVRTYTSDKTPVLISAITNFTANFNDTKAAILPTLIQLGTAYNSSLEWTVNLFYDASTPPPHLFAEFEAIEAVSDTTGTIRYPTLLEFTPLPKIRSADVFNSFPNLPEQDMVQFLVQHTQRVLNSSFVLNLDIDFIFLNIAFQSIPVALQQANYARGPAALQTDPRDGDKMWLEYTLGWNDTRCDFTCVQMLEAVVEDGKLLMQSEYPGVTPTHWKHGDVEEVGYNPILPNDAGWGQDIYQSYGNSSYVRLRTLQRLYDPAGVFFTQTNGFKL